MVKTSSTSVIPQPINKVVVCSVCDELWSSHGDNPTLMDCIRLLKQKNNYVPYPTIRPIPYWQQYWYTNGGNLNQDKIEVTYKTPADA